VGEAFEGKKEEMLRSIFANNIDEVTEKNCMRILQNLFSLIF